MFSHPQTEDQNIVTNALAISLTDENTAAAVCNLVSDLSAQLETLRRIAEQKEAAARQAKADVIQVENQLRTLLLASPASGQASQSIPCAHVMPITTESCPSTSGTYSWAEGGRCKFRCSSTTHEFASDCDVYPTISYRTARMRS
ncbi:unnamed protein product [Nippostrongylus brasiliensis]|uniref:Uncharacterized protein n=1 Tax=Nippostrongylus brasiliensis TaxID=27835 RepID=A0A0N4XJ88_NIPBR|nr:unnamed protein product [Nippostrongylus brasiliensis]